jgi:preprotein translocase subunit SecE
VRLSEHDETKGHHVSDRAHTASGSAPSKGEQRRGVFARIVVFVRQVIAELKKVVRPTRAELVRYTIVVLVFVLVVMAFVTVVDLGVGSLVGWVFSG